MYHWQSTSFVLDGGGTLGRIMEESSSDRLRYAARLRGLTDAPALAELTRIPVSTVRSNLNGHRQVSKRNAPQYARRLNVEIDWLLYGKGTKPSLGEEQKVVLPHLGIIDEAALTLRVDRSQPVVTPEGATGLAFLSHEGTAIVVELDRAALEVLRKNLLALENYLASR